MSAATMEAPVDGADPLENPVDAVALKFAIQCRVAERRQSKRDAQFFAVHATLRNLCEVLGGNWKQHWDGKLATFVLNELGRR